ncbi:MAG: hypothetical protein QW244_01275 [Candidatus Pacearchaeota archaeon]
MIKIALVGSIVGLFLLFILSSNLTPKKVSINEINEKNIDDWVVVEGKVDWIRNYDKLTLFQICDSSCIVVVSYNEIKNLELNKSVEIVGRIKLYKGNKEIEAEKVIEK